MKAGLKQSQINSLVSVIITNFNRTFDVINCINSVENQSYKEIEIILIDDCSNIKVFNYLKSNLRNVKFFRNKNNHGPNYSINKAVSKSSGYYILILDSDVILERRRIISNLVSFFKSHNLVGSVGGHYLKNSNEIFGFDFNGPIKIGDSNYKECAWLAGSNILTTKPLFDKVGGFNYLAKGEDTDMEFGLSLSHIGLKNYVLKNGAVLHLESKIERDNIGVSKKFARNFFRHVSSRRNRLMYVLQNFLKIKSDLRFNLLFYDLLIMCDSLVASISIIKKFLFHESYPKKYDLFFHMKRIIFHIYCLFDSYVWNLLVFLRVIR